MFFIQCEQVQLTKSPKRGNEGCDEKVGLHFGQCLRKLGAFCPNYLDTLLSANKLCCSAERRDCFLESKHPARSLKVRGSSLRSRHHERQEAEAHVVVLRDGFVDPGVPRLPDGPFFRLLFRPYVPTSCFFS